MDVLKLAQWSLLALTTVVATVFLITSSDNTKQEVVPNLRCQERLMLAPMGTAPITCPVGSFMDTLSDETTGELYVMCRCEILPRNDEPEHQWPTKPRGTFDL